MSTVATKVHIVPDPRADPGEVVIEGSLPSRWRWPEGGSITLRAGLREMEMRIQPVQPGEAPAAPSTKKDGATIRLHPQTLTRFALPATGLRCHVKLSRDEQRSTLSIGPFLGIFGQRGAGPQPFGGHELYFRWLSANGRSLAIPTYVFSARDVDWTRGVVRGFQWGNRGPLRRWYRHEFPMPDVVYDRLMTRKAEVAPAIQAARRRLASIPGLIYFNPGFFDKWTTHKQLYGRSELQRHLPATEHFGDRDAFRAFLRRYPVVFLKPSGGSLGLGIVVVRRTRTGFRATFFTQNGIVRQRHGTFDGLTAALSKYMGRRDYVMQQGLRLARVGGRSFDIRILMQKDRGGQWHQTKSYVRIAPPGSLTSNLSAGGTAAHLAKGLRAAFGSHRGRHLVHKVRDAATVLTPIIEEQIGGPLGELGLDLGIDRAGRLWILEVNSKPYIQMTRGSGSPKAIRLSAVRPLRWARYVSGYEPEVDLA